MPTIQALACAVVVLLPRAFGQNVTEFEVASVKPSDPASVISIRRSGDRLNTSNTSAPR